MYLLLLLEFLQDIMREIRFLFYPRLSYQVCVSLIWLHVSPLKGMYIFATTSGNKFCYTHPHRYCENDSDPIIRLCLSPEHLVSRGKHSTR